MPDAVTMLLFPEDFAVPHATPPVVAEQSAPAFGEADLAAARTEGYEAGVRDAHEAAAAAQRAHVAALLDVIVERLAATQEAAVRAVEACAEELAHLLLDAIGIGFPALRAQYGETELRSVIAAIAPALSREIGVVLRVHPSMREAVARELAALPMQSGTLPQIEASEEVPPGDAAISWCHGGAARDSAAAWREATEVLRLLGLLPGAAMTE
jgi:flagellar assembly protein FliH